MKIIHAHILVPAFHQYRLDCEIDGWINMPNDGCQHFITEVDDNINSQQLWSRVNSLRMLLLALFLDDLTPRKIKCFSYDRNSDENYNFNFHTVLGTSQEFDSRQDHESFFMSSEIFNSNINNDPFYSPNVDSLRMSHTFLAANPNFARNLDFLVDSFVIINQYFNNQDYKSQNDLLKGIVLLISSLEGIFLNNQENSADVSFKFQLIGSLFYDKYADADFIRGFGMNQRKFSRKEFSGILKELYALRSKIAHGNHDRLFAVREWKKFLTLKNVAVDDLDTIPYLYRNIALACGLLQKHIVALILGAKEDILLGVKIIDQIKIREMEE